MRSFFEAVRYCDCYSLCCCSTGMQMWEEGERIGVEASSFVLSKPVSPHEGLLLYGTKRFSILCRMASSPQCFTSRLKTNLQPVSCPSQGIFHSETSWNREFFSVLTFCLALDSKIVVNADTRRFFIGRVPAETSGAADF